MLVKTTATGSKGNNYVLISGEEILLLECGVPAKEMLKTIDYQTSKVVGCLLSHEHGDHAKYIKQYMQYGVKVYGSDEVQSNIELIYGEKIEGIKRMNRKKLGSFSVIPFRVPHGETDCDGWLIDAAEGRVLFITDAEYCPYDFSKMNINYGLIECNYSMDYITLEDDGVKNRRVLETHMELQTCKRLVQSINTDSLRSIGLVHLSAYNGNPQRFRDEIRSQVDADVDIWVAEKGEEKEFKLEPF
jgi:phosphoribosyl 1,2-cyclic phosphodiesterase